MLVENQMALFRIILFYVRKSDRTLICNSKILDIIIPKKGFWNDLFKGYFYVIYTM